MEFIINVKKHHDIIVSLFDFQSYNYVHFQTNTLGEKHEPSYPSCNYWFK